MSFQLSDLSCIPDCRVKLLSGFKFAPRLYLPGLTFCLSNLRVGLMCLATGVIPMIGTRLSPSVQPQTQSHVNCWQG